MSNKRTVILSTNTNPDYMNYMPYVEQAWNLLGWDTLTYVINDTGKEYVKHNDNGTTARRLFITSDRDFREDTYTQTIRLLGHHDVSEGIVMTGDIDMMPLSNYWNPDTDKWTVYGRDLTGYTQHPICYIAAPKQMWNELFPEQTTSELLHKYGQFSKSPHFNDYWFTDQVIATERITNYFALNRGIDNGLALGRIDRANWNNTMQRVVQLRNGIDAHMPRPFNLFETERCLQILNDNINGLS